MSSPYRTSEHSKPSPRSSPSRQRLEDSRNGRVNGLHRESTPLRDSPSRQLWEDLGRIVLDDDRSFKRSLDVQTAEQEKLHRRALDEALAQHEAVRDSAERARERLELEMLRERRRREAEEQEAVQEQKRLAAAEEAEQERRRLAAVRRTEEERRQQETLRREQEEAQRRMDAQTQREEQERAERSRKAAEDKQEADRKAREDAAAQDRQKQEQAQKAVPPPQQTNGVSASALPAVAAQQANPTTPAAPSGVVTTIGQRQAVHDRYTALWRKLKVFRQTTEKQCRDAGFKNLGQLKRDMSAKVGMINKRDKAANRTYLLDIEAILKQAIAIPNGPMVDVREYLPSIDQSKLASATDVQYPAILLYLLHQFAKQVIRQLTFDAGNDTEMADPIGIVVVQVFSRPDFQWQGISLIDVLWAKYHVRCPQLFGVRAPERPAGDEDYFRKVVGLSAGFTAITLRDFSKNRNRNPAPNALWWEAVARIVNTPAGQTQVTHYVILKTCIAEHVPRILHLFGGAGKALIRAAVRDFPAKGPTTAAKNPGESGRMLPAVMALESLAKALQLNYSLSL